jgi:hypothetical protein
MLTIFTKVKEKQPKFCPKKWHVVFTSHEVQSEWLDESRIEHDEHPCVSAISTPRRDSTFPSLGSAKIPSLELETMAAGVD